MSLGNVLVADVTGQEESSLWWHYVGLSLSLFFPLLSGLPVFHDFIRRLDRGLRTSWLRV